MSTTEGGGKIVTDGLILYYDGANPQSYISGDTVCNDLSITQSIGTLENGVTYDTDNNGSWGFDGCDCYVDCTNDAAFSVIERNLPFTFSVWVKVNSYAAISILMAKRNGVQGGGVFLALSNNVLGTLRWCMTTVPFTSYCLDTTVTINTGIWYDITATYDGTDANGMNVYINGAQAPTAIFFNTLNGSILTSIPVTFGAGHNEFYLDGNIASARIYNRELTQEEITQNYNAMKSRFK